MDIRKTLFAVGETIVRSCRPCDGRGYRRSCEVVYDDPTYRVGFFDSPFMKVKCTTCNGVGLTKVSPYKLNMETVR